MIYDIIVIGAGTAGLTASVYARRAGRSVLVMEQETFGGQIIYSPNVENYPGIPSVSGNAFADALMDQAAALGAEMELSGVRGIKKRDDGLFEIDSEYGAAGEKYECRSVIVATGASHRKLGIDGEEELTGNGVSYCALCDGAFYKGQDAAVVGGGDTACQDAAFLSGLCRKVYLIHRRDTFRAEKSNVDKLRAFANVEFVLDSKIEALSGKNELTGVTVVNTGTGLRREIALSALFVAVGQVPGSGCFEGLLSLDPLGYIVAGEDTHTNVPGIFAAGDVRTKTVRQLTTAASDGAVAATEASKYLQSLEIESNRMI